MKTETNLRVLELRAKNVMRLKTAQVRPAAHVVSVRGKNGSGKTTLLECIRMAVAGKSAVPGKPIRDGADKGEIELDIGEYIVRRTFTGEDSYLHLETRDGQKVTSPQKVLDGLYNALTVDPLAFSRMAEKEQAAMLMKLAGLDFAKADAARKQAYDERTLVNRQLDYAEKKVRDKAIVGVFLDDIPEQEQSVGELADRASSLRKQAAEADSARARARDLDADIANTEARLDALKKQRASMVIPPAVSREEIEKADAALAKINDTNALVRRRNERQTAEQEAEALRKQADTLTGRIERIDEKKKEMLAESKLPVEGLEFDEGGVRLNGQPLAQASQAEKIRVSVAVALSLNPRLRVILVRDASLLDADSRAEMEKIAEEFDAQLWLEYIDADGEGGIHVVDGVAEDSKT